MYRRQEYCSTTRPTTVGVKTQKANTATTTENVLTALTA
jgi:hypothetical protein